MPTLPPTTLSSHPNHSRNSQPVTSVKENLAESTGVAQGWGLGELSRPLTQAYPTPVKAGLPQTWGWTVRLCCEPPFPPDPPPPPPRIILELISGHPRQGTSRPEIWRKMTQAQKSRVWVPNSGRWDEAFLFALPRALGSCRVGGGRRRNPYSPQMGAWF